MTDRTTNGHREPGSTQGINPLPAELDETCVAVYHHAIMHGHLNRSTLAADTGMDPADATKACRKLLKLKLLSNGDGDVLVPVHPDLGLMRLNAPLVDEIRERERVIDANGRHLRRISYLLAHTTTPRAAEPKGIRVVTEAAKVHREIETAILRCTDSIVTMQPGGPGSHNDFVRALPPDLSMLKRGTSLRILYQHTARANLGMRSYVGDIAAHGGLVRTTSVAFERMFIFDKKVAFVPIDPPERRTSGAAIITHPAVVLFLYRGFERLWTSAIPFEYEKAQYDDKVSVDIKTSLLRLMASGLKDETIANRLGMAPRTCRRHMSAIMAELNATSRFQAGVKIAQLGILSDHDGTPLSNNRADAHPAW